MYIEYIIIENFIVNFFIISCAQKIMKEKSKLTFVGIILSTIISVICPLFNLTSWTKLVIIICTSVLLTCLSFKFSTFKSFALSYLLLLGITFMFGGSVEMLKQLLGQTTILIVLFSTFVVYILSILVIKLLGRKKILDSFSFDVTIIIGEKQINEKGYLDSGNLLYDPITSKPICLITQKVFQKIYDENLVTIFLKKLDTTKLKNGHYIDINTALKGGKMLVFDIDKLLVKSNHEEKSFNNISLGLSFSGFEKAMHAAVLLHSSQILV